jgi:thiol-disulfide isomerase/thioredoxin
MIPFLLALACSEPAPAPSPAPAEEAAKAPEPPKADEPAPTAQTAQTAGIIPIAPAALKDQLSAPGSRPRLYNFWATWCGPCVSELPALSRFASEHPEIEVVLVNVDMPSIRDSKVVPFLEKRGVTGVTSLALDTEDPAGELPKVVPDWPDTIPVNIFVKADGTRAKQYNGAIGPTELEAGLNAAL